MEKRGRGGKVPSSQPAPQSAVTPRRDRRLSMFEKESVSARTAGCPAGRQASPVGSERRRRSGAAVAGGAAVP